MDTCRDKRNRNIWDVGIFALSFIQKMTEMKQKWQSIKIILKNYFSLVVAAHLKYFTTININFYLKRKENQ